MPDILDAAAANAQKAIDDAAKSAGVAPSAPPPAGDSPAPAAVTVPNPTPALPTEPAPAALPENPPSELSDSATASSVPSESVPQASPPPSDVPEPPLQTQITSEAPPQEPAATDQKNDQVVDEILSAPADTAPASPPPPQESSPKKKGRVKGFVLAILAVFLFTIPVAVYYVSQQNRQVAEVRTSAYPSDCGGCTLGAKVSCTINGQAGTKTCVNDENCINQPNKGSWGGCVATPPTPTQPPPVHSPCLYCGGTNGTCTRSALSNCDNSLNECQTVGSTNECANFVPTGCTEDGEVPTGRKPCCPNLNLINGRCRVGGVTPTPPSTPPGCSQVTCSSTSCTVGDMYDGTGASNCVVWHYKCPNDWPQGTGCQQNGTAGKSGSFLGCGTEQIDIFCPVCGFNGGQSHDSKSFITKYNQGSCGGGGETPACNGVKVYKDGAVVADLGSLHVNDHIVIAVSGGLATKAHIRVNGGAWTETSTKNANNEYTLDFTILPESIVNNKVTVEAEIWGTDNHWH